MHDHNVRRPWSAALLIAAATATPAALAQERAPRAVVVEADRIVVAPDTVLNGASARIAIRGGKVIAVGGEIPQDILDGAERLRFPGGQIVPGFVDPHHHLSLGDDLVERIDACTPDLKAVEAFDPFDDALERQARGGVTSVGLAPLSKNTFGGIAAVVKWDGEAGVVADDAGYLKMAIVGESLDKERYPTSRMGAADIIRACFRDARDPLALPTPDVQVLRDVLAGSRRAAIHARTHAEITAVLDLAEELSFTPILIGADEAHDSLDRLPRSGAFLCLAALDFQSDEDRLTLPAKLRAARVPFSFTARDPAALRLSAALAVRHGLDRLTALAALTRVPAEQLDLADRIGSLRVGCDADFLVFDGEPLDLTSRLSAVFVGGERLEAPSDPARAGANEETMR